MNINLQSVKQLAILSVATLLLSCGGGDDETPPPPEPIPEGAVSGVVMIGPVEGATITVYQIDPTTGDTNTETPLQIVKESTTALGKFSFTLQRDEAELPIVVCATGGSYSEPASAANNPDANKSFTGNQQLCAMTIYKKADADAKKTTDVNITFFTHLAYGLFKSKMAAPGHFVLDKPKTDTQSLQVGALNQANDDVAAWLNIDSIVTIEPAAINDPKNGNSTLSPEYAYGLAIVGMSSTVDWLVTANGIEQTFNGVSSIELAQLAHEDIKAEKGWLDGIGPDGLISLKGTTLDAHIYRHHLSARIMSVIDNKDINQTGLTLDKVLTFSNQLGNHTTTVFDPGASTHGAIDESKPNISHDAGTFDISILYTDNITFTVTIFDLSGIKNGGVTLTVYNTAADGITKTTPVASSIDLTPEPQDANTTLYLWKIPTIGVIPDGTYVFEVKAINNLGAVSDPFDVPKIKINNSPISVNISSPLEPDAKVNPENAFSAKVDISASVVDGVTGTNVVFDLVDIGTLTPTSAIDVIAAATQKLPLPAPKQSAIPGTTDTKNYGLTAFDVSTQADGNYYLRVVATQNVIGLAAGEVQAFDAALRLLSIDHTKPTIKFSTPADGTIQTKASLPIVGVVDDPKAASGYASGVKAVSGHAGSSPITGTASGTAATITTDLPADVWTQVTIDVDDFAGNHGHSAARWFAYDSKPPTVSYTSVPDVSAGNLWINSLQVNATVKDGIGIEKVYYTFGTGSAAQGTKTEVIKPNATGFSKSYPFTITPTADTTIKDVIIVAEDRSAAIKGIATIAQVGFDSTAPIINFPNPTFPTRGGAGVVLTEVPAAAAGDFTLDVTVQETGAPTAMSGVAQPVDIATTPSTAEDNKNQNLLVFKDISFVTTTGKAFKATNPTPAKLVHTIDVRVQQDYDISAKCVMDDFSPVTVALTAAPAAGNRTAIAGAVPAITVAMLPTEAIKVTVVGTNEYKTLPTATAPNSIAAARVTVNPVSTVASGKLCMGHIIYTYTPTITASNPTPVLTTVNHYFYYPSTALTYSWTRAKVGATTTVAPDYYFVKAVSTPTTLAVVKKSTKFDVTAKDKVTPTPNSSTKTWCMETAVTVKPSKATSSYAAKNSIALTGTLTIPNDVIKQTYLTGITTIPAPSAKAASTTTVPATVLGTTEGCWNNSGNAPAATPAPLPAANAIVAAGVVTCALYPKTGATVDVLDVGVGPVAGQKTTGSGLTTNFEVIYSSFAGTNTAGATTGTCP